METQYKNCCYMWWSMAVCLQHRQLRNWPKRCRVLGTNCYCCPPVKTSHDSTMWSTEPHHHWLNILDTDKQSRSTILRSWHRHQDDGTTVDRWRHGKPACYNCSTRSIWLYHLWLVLPQQQYKVCTGSLIRWARNRICHAGLGARRPLRTEGLF